MASSGEGIKGIAARETDGAGLKVVVIRTAWNEKIIGALSSGCTGELGRLGATDIVEVQVPGSYELPLAAKTAIRKYKPDAVICLGCLIKGDTMHFEYICEAVTQGIMRVQLDTGIPVIFGVLACLTEQQALDRAGLSGKGRNHGIEWAQSAVQMARLTQG